MHSIPTMLENAATKFSKKIYVANKEKKDWAKLSFKQVYELSQFVASFLLSMDIKKEDNIIILSEGRNNWVIAEHGIIMSGAVSVPLSIKLQAEEITFRVNHSEAKAIFVSKNYIDKVFSVSENYKKDIKYFFLDDDKDYLIKKANEYNIKDDRLFIFNNILKLGKEKLEINKKQLSEIKNNIKVDDTVTISYTSGTTGNPKGIMLTHKNYWANCNDAIKIFKVPEDFKTLLILPCDHSFAHTVGIFSALLKGISLYFVDASGGGMNALKNIPKNLIEVNSDFILTVPALTSNFMNKIKDGIELKGKFISWLFNTGINAGIKINGNGYSKTSAITKLLNIPIYFIIKELIFSKIKQIWGKDIKYFVGGGALLDIYQQEFFAALGVPVYQGYGLTEASPIISANTPFVHKYGTSGKILPNVLCKIVDENDNELPQGEKGQIVVKGGNVMKSYYKNPEETAKTIKNGVLYTGDLGYFDNDGFLVVTGREKALLISEDGEKYSPEEIEEAITSNSEIIEQVMLYNDHKKITSSLITINKEKLKNHIKQKGIKDEKEILNEINKSLHKFKVNKNYKNKFPEKWTPSTFRIIEEHFTEQNQMVNSTMKIVRHKITEHYKNEIDFLYSKEGNKPFNERNIRSLRNIIRS